MKKSRFGIMVASLALATLSLGVSGCGVMAHANQGQAATTSNTGSQMEWAFTQAQQHPEKQLIRVIDGAHQSLDIAIYSLTERSIVNAILDAKKRWVGVRVITDQQEAQNRYQAEALNALKKAGIPVKLNTHKGLMHLKVTIADQSIVTTGSFNYTQAASTTNDEVLVVVHDTKMAQAFADQFERMWRDQADFANF